MKSVQEAIENTKKAIPTKATMDNYLTTYIFSKIDKEGKINVTARKDFEGIEHAISGIYKDAGGNHVVYPNLTIPIILKNICDDLVKRGELLKDVREGSLSFRFSIDLFICNS